jgi:hypothetical protein
MWANLSGPIVTLAAVLLGWLLGEGTSQIREWRKRRRILAALAEELLDCESFIRRNIITSEQLIQIVAVKAFAGFVPVAVPQTVFEKYYPDLVVRLRRGERISFSAIHTRIREMNKMTEDIAAQMAVRSPSEESFERLAELLAAFRITAQIAAHMITFHRASGRRVDPWILKTKEAKEIEAKFMTEVQKLRSEAVALGYDEVTRRILTATE